MVHEINLNNSCARRLSNSNVKYFVHPRRALSVVWTTPLVATLGMSLTIPLAMVADMVIHGRHYSAIYVLGSAQVLSNLSRYLMCVKSQNNFLLC